MFNANEFMLIWSKNISKNIFFHQNFNEKNEHLETRFLAKHERRTPSELGDRSKTSRILHSTQGVA